MSELNPTDCFKGLNTIKLNGRSNYSSWANMMRAYFGSQGQHRYLEKKRNKHLSDKTAHKMILIMFSTMETQVLEDIQPSDYYELRSVCCFCRQPRAAVNRLWKSLENKYAGRAEYSNSDDAYVMDSFEKGGTKY